ncbi:(deoxy)nucleoside triphosphate pyrophosphohydrolase [candidate division KSB1 bacterium]|nr:(deoxy)nucleoside triphosphate pyrophosphohydrolase [candidate division KSB1 bacterium]
MNKSNFLNVAQNFQSFGIIHDSDGYFEIPNFESGTNLQIHLRLKDDILLETYFNQIGIVNDEIQTVLKNLASLIKNKPIHEILQTDFYLKFTIQFPGSSNILLKGFEGLKKAISDYQKRALSTSGINVAGGLIWNGDYLLIAQRHFDDSLGSFWEFPGGKCEPDETLASALVREIKEELDISIRTKDLYAKLESGGHRNKITLFILNCDYLDGTPLAIDCADWKWIKPSQLTQFEFTPLDQRLIPEIINLTLK